VTTEAPDWLKPGEFIQRLTTIPAVIRVPLPPDCEATEEWLFDVSQANEGWRIELGHNGELIINEGAGGDSSDIGVEIVAQMRDWRVSGGGGRVRESSGPYWVADAAGDEALLVPDISWVSPEQLQAVPREERGRVWHLCPAFVVEVRSPNQSLPSQQGRMEHWIELGVQLGWLIDPRGQSVWIYRPDQKPERYVRPDQLDGEDIMPGLNVDFAEIWDMADDLASL
jgi:Uma2 family endonuclease